MNNMLEALASRARDERLNIYRIAMTDESQNPETVEITPGNPCQDCYSVAKVFTATAVGLLFDKGLLSLEDRIANILKDELPRGYDPQWNLLTIRHALTHRCGLPQGYLDIDCDDINDYATDDFLARIFLNTPNPAPGEKYCYTDAAYYMLSRVATKIAGEEMDDFLWRELFRPLGVREAAWSKCPKGHAMGGTGLYIRARDVAVLGSVYACGGVWHGRRLLSEAWIKETTENECAFYPLYGGKLWAKGGMCGQMMAFSIKKRLAFAWHGYNADTQPILNRIAELIG